jgi:putative heme-binding domain-containing protein
MFAGMRNAYDHAYNLAGEAFTFDSDMEWDINLPWFKEVRTVHGVTGGDFGWRSGSRNLPDYQIDTLPPVRDLGRGSPVGIEFYHHSVYPKQFFDALFEADWSRGRLLYTGLTPNGATYKARDDRAEFVHGEPLNITDLEVAPDGMIYFSMGGRTTDGGVFRVRYTGPPNRTAEPKRILASVRQPQPLSSWGWAALEKQKESMGAAWAMELEQLARDGSADGQDRAQALYLLQRHGPAPSLAVLNQLIADRDVKVRAAVVYVAGNQHSDGARAIATTALEDGDPFVRRRALEALLVMGIEADKPGFAPVADVYRLLNDPDRVLRFIARVTLERMPRPQWQERVLNETNPLGALEGMVALVNTRPSPNEARALVGKQIEWMRRTDLSVEDQLRLQRAFQLTAIEAPGAITPHVRRQVHEALVARFPAQDERLNRQTALTLAYAGQPEAIGKILDAIPQGDENQPLQIHYVYALRAIKNGWTKEQKARLMNWFGKAVAWRGGASFAGYLNLMFDSSLKFFDPAEKKVAYEMVPLFKPVSEEELKAVLARQNRFGGGRPGGPPNPQAVARARIGANARARGVQVLSKEEILEYQLFVPVGERPNPAAGHVLYEKACGKCHRFGGIGTDFGPDLTTIASRFKKKDILESTLWPSKTISDQYPSTIIELKSGEIVNGLVSRETAQAIQVRTADSTDRPITIPKTQIKEQRQSSISTMPEGLLDEFNQVEIASLLAFLMGPPPGSTDRR